MPAKVASAPIGSCIGTAFACRRSCIMSTTRKKSAPMMSILLTYAMRGTLIFRRLTPYGFGLGLDAALGAENGNRTVQHAQGALYLDREVHVAGGVNNVDLIVRFHSQVVAADVMVMPRSCSCAIQSIVAAPSWVSPSTVRATGVVQYTSRTSLFYRHRYAP